MDLSSGSGAVLSFDYRRQALDNENDYITLEISADGGDTWTELDRFAGPDNDEAFVTARYDVSGYASARTRIRFRTPPSGMNQYDKLFVDNVKISYDEAPDSYYPSLVGADALHAQGIDGTGVTVAVIDTGYFAHEALTRIRRALRGCWPSTTPSRAGRRPGVGYRRPRSRRARDQPDRQQQHLDQRQVQRCRPRGQSGLGQGLRRQRPGHLPRRHPCHRLGGGRTSDTYGIRVLNLSFSARPRSHYWDDP